ncbi:hypothetical protein QGM71_18680 [Virgibacillus sp. C22-A2]|uniref:Uncharacterized protein n=1 Tax=Virgibacillus tibetensis TaxID=3042313 RepID=A0ABU6KK55_9BACI|nr:hypothetical protein [Virgibacillus sp. C22-A2]
MASETYLDFCFVQKSNGSLAEYVQSSFEQLFKHERRLRWHFDEKQENHAEIIVAEVKGMSRWASAEDLIDYLEEHASEKFWSILQGYQFQVLPVTKGCSTNGNR